MTGSQRMRFNRGCSTIAVCLLLLSCDAAPNHDTGQHAEELADTLRSLIEEAYDFGRPDIVERMTALYPDTGRVVSASGGQLTSSPDSLRHGIATFWHDVGRNMREPRWVWGDVLVDHLGDDAAVMSATWSIPHIAPNNQPHVIRGAWTAVFRRINGEWKIVHEHLSVPE